MACEVQELGDRPDAEKEGDLEDDLGGDREEGAITDGRVAPEEAGGGERERSAAASASSRRGRAPRHREQSVYG